MTLDFLIVIFLSNYYKKSLQESGNLEKWEKILKGLLIAAIIFLAIEIIGSKMDGLMKWLAHFLLFYMVYLTFREKDFSHLKNIMYAVLPFVVISTLGDLAEMISAHFYNYWEKYFDNAVLFSIVWMFGMQYIVRKQKKAIEKERLKTKDVEAESQITAALKAQLEVQVAERTAELTFQKEELQHIVNELKSTQAQLIQAEKMASLGELTAGIAHEIQNPLNFVNNFSEVNTELIDELKEEIDKGNIEDALSIMDDIKENEQKINHHGRRADAIVKGMLQHSRTSSGKKEPTDINALADEYLRLSYHGLRAKDKTFNAAFSTDLDESVGKINLVSQDMGRVLLNLFNNAFYSTTEKKKQLNGSFEPKVAVSTKKITSPTGETDVVITVKDNGNGIPQKVVDKIFQPFFTTKPSGQGTGLGLSISYDIIKAHGGEMEVLTREGEGAEFIIKLPQ